MVIVDTRTHSKQFYMFLLFLDSGILKDAVEDKPDLKSVLQRVMAGAKARKTARLENSALAMKIKTAAEREQQQRKQEADNKR